MLDSLQLSKKVIDLDELRMLAAQGVPDAAGVRSTVWKVLDWLAFLCVFSLRSLFYGQGLQT